MDRIRSLAGKILSDPAKLRRLIRKSGQLLNTKNPGADIVAKVRIMAQMLTCHIRGEYRALSYQSLLLLVFGLLYFVIPTDLVPDVFPAGLLDDASILLGVHQSLSADIRAFHQWNEATNAEVD